MSDSEIFDYYRAKRAMTEEDKLDYLSLVCDAPDLVAGAMAVSGLTLSLIENGWDRERMLLLVQSVRLKNAEDEMVTQERAIIGLLLVMIQYDVEIRSDMNLLEQIQEVLSKDTDAAFAALCNIARTTQVKRVMECNTQMTKELMPFIQNQQHAEMQNVIKRYQAEIIAIAQLQLDQNYIFFKDLYKLPFFYQSPANWFRVWEEESLKNVAEEDREDFDSMLNRWPICDSDKFALTNHQTYKMLKGLVQDRLQMDSLSEIGHGSNMEGLELFSNLYTQQLYRYFTLSSFTQAKPFEKVHQLRATIVYRLIVVGSENQATISKLLS